MKAAKRQSIFLRSLVYISAGLTITTVVGILVYIIIKGVSHLSWDLFAFKYTSENVSLFPALVNTFTMTVVALFIAAPMGIFSGIYLVEYANRDSKAVKLIRLTTETLSGIPSIVFGLFGYLLFVSSASGFGWGYSMLAGAFSLAIMILPVIMRSTEEALKSVPDTYREGSFGLGAGKLRTVFKIVLPAAIPGILAGIILSIGRIVGETAVLIYTSGTVAHIPKNLMGSGRTLSIHLYALWSEGMNTESAYATAVILVVTVSLLNALSAYLAKKFTKGNLNG